MLVRCVASPISATPVIRPRPAVDQRHPRRRQRAEGQQQDQQRRHHAHLGRRTDAESLGILDYLTTGEDLKPGNANRVDLVQHGLSGVAGEHVRRLVVVDRRERGRPIGRDLDSPLRAVGADDPGDMWEPAHAHQQRRHRRAHGRRVDRSARDVEYDRVRVAALSLELVLEQVNRALRLGPWQAEYGGVVRPHSLGHDRGEDRHGHPAHHDAAAVSDAPSSETQHLLTGTKRRGQHQQVLIGPANRMPSAQDVVASCCRSVATPSHARRAGCKTRDVISVP